MNRYKPVGWRMESMRHSLAAKGVKTKEKPYFIKEPYGLPFELTEKDKFRKLPGYDRAHADKLMREEKYEELDAYEDMYIDDPEAKKHFKERFEQVEAEAAEGYEKAEAKKHSMAGKDLELKDIGQYTGTEGYHKLTQFTKTVGTDGIAYLEDSGYAWFVTDQVIALEGDLPKGTDKSFLAVKLKVNPDHTAVATIEDGNGKVLRKQEYKYTDAKKDLVLYYQGGVLMLSGEY